MEPVVGIFPSRASAEAGVKRLFSRGFAEEQVSMLLPGEPATPAELEDEVPTEDAEQSGTGPAVGGVVGAAAGASAGFGAGVIGASLLVPGVGAVTAIGLAAAALFGAAGAVGGAHMGEVLEETRRGIPKDELYLYEDALAHGYGIVFATRGGWASATRRRRTTTPSTATSRARRTSTGRDFSGRSSPTCGDGRSNRRFRCSAAGSTPRSTIPRFAGDTRAASSGRGSGKRLWRRARRAET